MAEVDEESNHVWSSKPRIALFLGDAPFPGSAAAPRSAGPLWGTRGARIHRLPFRGIDAGGGVAAWPGANRDDGGGEWRVQEAMANAARKAGVPRGACDRHFYETRKRLCVTPGAGRQLRMEQLLPVNEAEAPGAAGRRGEPEGGQWNFDPRTGDVSKSGPRGEGLSHRGFTPPDAITREVLALVKREICRAPRSLETFVWPTPEDAARRTLVDFTNSVWPGFGRFQMMMWTEEPGCSTSRLFGGAEPS